MSKIKNGVESVITREEYNKIKKMDRREMEILLGDMRNKAYRQGYEQGRKDTKRELTKGNGDMPAAWNACSKEEFISFLPTIPGIEIAILRKIESATEQWSPANIHD